MSAVRRSRRRRWWQPAVVMVAGAVTLGLTQNTTGAVFTGQTADTGNSVQAAPDFCTAPGRVDTLSAGTVDTGVSEANPATNYSASTSIGVAQTASSTGRARTLIKFPLLARPSGCVVASAVLKLHVSSAGLPANVTVYRAAGAWDASAIWTTAPGIVAGSGTSTAATGTGTTTQWNVQAQVTALYAGPDYGFQLRDNSETVGSLTQLYDSMDSATASFRPQLVITWG